MQNLKSILNNKRGETLMEGILSILIFTVLVASITTMIIVSLRITAVSTEAAEERQAEANAVLTGTAADEISDDTVDFTINGIVFSIDVTVYETDDFLAFEP